MKNLSKQVLTAVSLVLLLVVAAFMTNAPMVKAAVVEIDTNAYVMLSPSTAQVSNAVLVSFRIDKERFGAIDYANHFEGYTVTITKPDGKTETKGPYSADATSGSWFMYTPTTVGTYTFQMHFPAQWSNGTSGGVPYNYLYKSSDSPVVSLIMQTEPVPSVEGVPLPTGYWTRPISAENKGWYQVADNWLMRCYDHPSRGFCVTTAFAPYTSAPNSAHILWNKPIIFGGIGGGKYGDKSYYTGLSYEQFYTPLILEGRIIYTEHGPTTSTAFGTHILNLYTGEEIMFLNNTDIQFAQMLEIDNPNEHGLLPYLWYTTGSSSNSTWFMYDAFTGRQILTMTNVTWGGLGGFNGGPTAYGPNGEILSYSFGGTAADRRLICFNSTKAMSSRVGIDVWSPAYGSIIDGRGGIQYNVSVPFVSGISITTIGEGYILGMARDASGWPYVETHVCYNQATGQQLWSINRTEIYTAFFGPNVMAIREGMYVERDEGKMVCYAYDIKTGAQLWVSEPLPNGWGIFEYQRDIAYGRVYTTGYTGAVRAYDAQTGSLVWTYDMGNAGYETPYGVWPTYSGFTIADGKLFHSNDEHSPDSVLWRGSRLWAINTTTGNLTWSISGMMRNPVVADGMLTALNSYDGQVYTFGKGPSATSVSTPDVAVPLGTKVLIKGSVTDQSPGQKGTPAISDESMSAWMEYLHMYKSMPTDATGVPVTLTAVDPNGNTQDVGAVISDDGGSFGIVYTPTLEGKYQIKATFEGTNSYGGSYATTYMVVGAAQATAAPTATPTSTPTLAPTATPAPTVSPSPAPSPPGTGLGTEYYIAIAAVVIIIAIAAVAVILRRRK
jgi:outer membrane protein assembly factor BamB